MVTATFESWRLSRQNVWLLLLFLLLTALFVLAPWSGDDWGVYYGAAKRVVNGQPLYGTLITRAPDAYFLNPPWLAVALTPAALLPEKLGWAMLSAASLGAALLLLNHWQRRPGAVKALLALSNPAMVYIILHGQIDLLIASSVLLPAMWWPLAALTKPQVAIGLLVTTPRRHWVAALGILAGIVLVTFLLCGFWPPRLFSQPMPFAEANHNFWLGLWPYQVPVGVALAALAYQRQDTRLAIAASPFLSPYAALSTLIGPWIALLTCLTRWQAIAVWASWWGAVLYRAVAG